MKEKIAMDWRETREKVLWKKVKPRVPYLPDMSNILLKKYETSNEEDEKKEKKKRFFVKEKLSNVNDRILTKGKCKTIDWTELRFCTYLRTTSF